jgi:tRNA A-37 threonylcarbamoyl transferase component Bud32
MMSMVSCLFPLRKKKAPPFDDTEVLRLSEAAIAKACKTAPPVYALGKNWDHVVRLSNNILVKYGWHIELAEARNMQFVYENEPLVRVPKCFRSFQVEDKDSISVFSTITYIVMEYIPGTVLSDCWNKMSENRRQNVCDKVVEAICKLQQLHVQRPGPIGGGLCRAPNELFSLAGAGPFSSIADIEKWYSHRLWLCKRMRRVQDDRPPFEGTFGDSMVMSHLDIAMRNIIIQADDAICLIDWGFAGAYPSHFERYVLERQQPCDREFLDRVLERLPEYKNEIEKLEIIGFALTSVM